MPDTVVLMIDRAGAVRRVWAVLATVLCLWAGAGPGAMQAHAAELHETRPLMGTVVDITIEDADAARLRPALEVAYQEMSRLSDMMNHYSPTSVVSAINMAAGIQPVPVPTELMQVLKMAREASERSHGAFDITIGALRGWRFNPAQPAMPSPEQIEQQRGLVNFRDLVLDERAGTAYLRRQGMRIDLGGIAKLYILEEGVQSLRRQGVVNAMINGGGDVVVSGRTRGQPWRVGVRDPREPERLLGVVLITRGVLASSGDYERFFVRDGRRYHHIIDPRTGYPTQGVRGVTLLADDAARLNGLSAAVMVLGAREGRQLIERTPGLDGLIVDAQGQVWRSPGMARRLQALPTARQP